MDKDTINTLSLPGKTYVKSVFYKLYNILI